MHHTNPWMRRLPPLAMFIVAALSVGSLRSQDEAKTLVDARRLLLRGRYEEAQTLYARSAQKSPAAAVGLARCRAAVGDPAAKEGLEEAAKSFPKDAAVRAELAWLALGRGGHVQAERWSNEALKLDDQSPRARWVVAELHRLSGRLKEAEAAYDWFLTYHNKAQSIDDPDALLLIGRAAGQLARWRRNSKQFSFLVNELYPRALKLEKNFWPAHLASAEIFLEKFNQRQTVDDLNAALAVNPRATEALTLRAELALINFDLDQAERSVRLALKTNPHSIRARQLQADTRLAQWDYPAAIKVLEEARNDNPRDEATLGRLAAAYAAADGLTKERSERVRAILDEAVKRNPHCGRVYLAMAESIDLMRKYPFAAPVYEEAIRLLPQLTRARGSLGLLYMRLGQETQAAKLLNESFEIDPFNVRVKNMLEVLDVLNDYAVLETEHFVLRFNRGIDGVLADHAARHLEEYVYPVVVKELGHEPEGKTLIEIFSRARNTKGHSWFSARMVGLPFIGTVGACAGRMVALASPNEMPGKYNWATTLKHEFVHVVNLQQTHFNIPHWFTEAMAVRMEDRARPTEWVELLARRTADDSLFDLSNINLGFVRPRSSDDWTLAYCQSEAYAEFMVERFGDDALRQMLDSYAANLSTEAALKKSFGVTMKQFESEYLAFVRKIVKGVHLAADAKPRPFGALLRDAAKNPDDADLQAAVARAHFERDNKPQARRAALAAQKIKRDHPVAAYVLARIHLSIGDEETAVKHLQASLHDDAPNLDVLRLLAAIHLRRKQPREAEKYYLRGEKAFPHPDRWNKLLARVYLRTGEKEKLRATLTRLAALSPDNLAYCKKLAQLHFDDKDFDKAAEWANQAIQIDVMDAAAQAALGEASLRSGQPKRAALALTTAVQLDATKLAWRFNLARAQAADKRPDEARRTLDALLKLDAGFPGARKLREELR